MSKQDLLLYYVSSCHDRGLNEDEIIERFTKYKDISLSEIKEAIEIYKYKPVIDENPDIPSKWISRFMHFVKSYSLKPEPLTIAIGQHYFNKVLTFLNGADLVKLEIALTHSANTLFEDFSRQHIQNNPVLGVVLNTDDIINFPCYQQYTSWKFLYHLLFAYPNLSIMGGEYANKNNRGLAKKTCLSLYNHRKYLMEKAMKAGGLAFVLNVFNRIVLNEPFIFPPKPKPISPPKPEDFDSTEEWNNAWIGLFAARMINHEYGTYSIDGNLNDIHIIPKFDDNLFYFMNYFCSIYLSSGYDEQFVEKFEMECDIDIDDEDEYQREFRRFMEKLRYQGMCKFIQTVRPKLPDYPWKRLLTQHLGMIAYGNYECVGLLMDLGAKINLSEKIRNDKTCDVITETLDGRNQTNAIKTLIQIFKRAKEDDFQDADEKISVGQIRAILDHFTNYRLLRQLVSTLLSKTFVLSNQALACLRRVRL